MSFQGHWNRQLWECESYLFGKSVIFAKQEQPISQDASPPGACRGWDWTFHEVRPVESRPLPMTNETQSLSKDSHSYDFLIMFQYVSLFSKETSKGFRAVHLWPRRFDQSALAKMSEHARTDSLRLGGTCHVNVSESDDKQQSKTTNHEPPATNTRREERKKKT